jgi:hypothetical protein
MATKTTNQPKVESESPTANWNFLFKWLFILGGLAAGVLNALITNEVIVPDDQYTYIVTALMAVGIIVGIFYFNSDDVINIGLRFMIFGAAANTIGGFYKLGDYLAPFFLGFSYYLGPIVLTLVVVYFVKKYILNR